MTRTAEATPVIRRDMDVRVEVEMCMAATLPIPKPEREVAGAGEEVLVKLSQGNKRLFARGERNSAWQHSIV